MRAAAYTQNGVDFKKLFHFLDKDRNGLMNRKEFARAIRRGKVTRERLSDLQLEFLFRLLDTNKSGTISLDELIAFVGDAEGGSGTSATRGWHPRLPPAPFTLEEI